jgi:GTP-binding protein
MSLSHPLPILAIVGRPNVGKSTLFNRIAQRKIAIVHEQAGVTRDRVSAPARWGDRRFEVMDTGGIAFLDEEKTTDFLAEATRRQAQVAVAMANAIILVVDVTSGVLPLDLDIARHLRTSGKPVFLAVNKVDHKGRAPNVDEFSVMGFEPLYPVAAAHGDGVEELLDAATATFPETATDESTAKPATRIAIVGRPNVGKSSLINCILQSERTIVSDVPGTTRDSVDAPFQLKTADTTRDYVLVDTAGLRHKRKIKSSVDQFGLMRAERSIRECDIAVLVIDASQGVSKQDKAIGGLITEARRNCVILVNKWDLVKEDEARANRNAGKQRGNAKTFREEFLERIRRELFFLDWAPVLFASARTGERVDELFRLVGDIEVEMARRVETPRLNQLISRSLEGYPPPFLHGKRFKVFYAFQKPGLPPTIALFVNDTKHLTPHYERFLIDRIRAVWPFTGCPVILNCQPRERRKFTPKSTKSNKFEKKVVRR